MDVSKSACHSPSQRRKGCDQGSHSPNQLKFINTQLSGTSFIGFSRSTGTQTGGRAINPATVEKLEPKYLTAAAFPVYSSLLGKIRAGLLRAIADKIEASIEDIAAHGPSETGLPEGRMDRASPTGSCTRSEARPSIHASPARAGRSFLR